jgi:hypothetical protein
MQKAPSKNFVFNPPNKTKIKNVENLLIRFSCLELLNRIFFHEISGKINAGLK